jgi:hypothetical protein
LVFLLHFTGFYIYFVLRLSEIHQEIRSQLKELPTEKLQIIKLSKREFQKAKEGDGEVKVDGKMYDIARIEVINENVLLYVIHDEAEDNLLSFLDEVLKNASRDKKQLPSGVFAFISQAALSAVLSLPTNSYKIREATSSGYLLQLTNFYPQLEVPPPKS